MKLLVIDAVGLRPKDLELCPNVRALAERGFHAPLKPVFPAVTCTAQASFLTGQAASGHGVVGNGWYFRDIAQVMFWRQANQLIEADPVYRTLKEQDPGFTTAKMFWWFNMYAPVTYSVTPRPEYHADGLKKFGLYSEPPVLEAMLQEKIGTFPFFNFWGPKAGLPATTWITDATIEVIKMRDPDLVFSYLPHLDYDHQRYGPDDPRSRQRVGELDKEIGKLIAVADEKNAQVIVLSEYGIEKVERPLFPNRWLNEMGWLRVQETSHGQLLDAGGSRAFAVCDHQIAHVYVRDPSDVQPLKKLLGKTDGVERALDREEQKELGIDHERSGEIVLISNHNAWFAYHYWMDDREKPDFATSVDIHRKPGYDPTELFVDPKIKLPVLKVAKTLLKKKLGFRYLMDVISTDPSLVGGSHGRVDLADDEGPVFVSSSKDGAADKVDSLEVRDRILRAVT